MRAVVFWVGFVLVFSGGMTASPANLLDLLMTEGSRKDLARQTGLVAIIIGGVLLLLAWVVL